MMKAFKIRVPSINSMDLLCFAITASKARYIAFCGCKDANYPDITFASIRVFRWKEWDAYAQKYGGKFRLYDPSMLDEVVP
jgi:hypothetical protein